MNSLAEIEAFYGRKLPDGYRKWVERGYTRYGSGQFRYLWIPEAEWIPVSEMPNYDLWRKPIAGLVPFAFTGGRDLWCFSTTYPTTPGEYEVWYCPRDEEMAQRSAPSFPGWFYRWSIEFAAENANSFEDIHAAKTWLRICSMRLDEIGPEHWAQHLLQLSCREPIEYVSTRYRKPLRLFGFLTQYEADSFVVNEFGERYLNEDVLWEALDDA